MTLTRTIRRREKRKRAKARKAEAVARWNALSPERRAMGLEMDRMMFGLMLPTLVNQLTAIRLFNRQYKG